MSLTANAIRKLAEFGLSGEQIADVADAMCNERSLAAERQKRYRDRKREERDVTRDVTQKETLPQTPTQEKIIPPSPPKGGSSPKRQTRQCPDDWSPSVADLAVGREEGFTPGEIERELAKFRDHTFATARSNWSSTFRNWIRRSAETRPKANGQPAYNPKTEARRANIERAFAASEAVAERWTG